MHNSQKQSGQKQSSRLYQPCYQDIQNPEKPKLYKQSNSKPQLKLASSGFTLSKTNIIISMHFLFAVLFLLAFQEYFTESLQTASLNQSSPKSQQPNDSQSLADFLHPQVQAQTQNQNQWHKRSLLGSRENKKQTIPKIIWLFPQNLKQEQIESQNKQGLLTTKNSLFYLRQFLLESQQNGNRDSSPDQKNDQFKIIPVTRQIVQQLFDETTPHGLQIRNFFNSNDQNSLSPKEDFLENSFYDIVKIIILNKFGGVAMSNKLIGLDNMSEFMGELFGMFQQNKQDRKKRNAIVNKWGDSAQAFMLAKQDIQKQFKSMIHSEVLQQWNPQYLEDLLIGSTAGSKFTTQLLQVMKSNTKLLLKSQYQSKSVQQLLKKCRFPSQQTLQSQQTLAKMQDAKTKQQIVSKKIEKFKAELLKWNIKCLLSEKQTQLNLNATKNDVFMDFVSAQRYYKLWASPIQAYHIKQIDQTQEQCYIQLNVQDTSTKQGIAQNNDHIASGQSISKAHQLFSGFNLTKQQIQYLVYKLDLKIIFSQKDNTVNHKVNNNKGGAINKEYDTVSNLILIKHQFSQESQNVPHEKEKEYGSQIHKINLQSLNDQIYNKIISTLGINPTIPHNQTDKQSNINDKNSKQNQKAIMEKLRQKQEKRKTKLNNWIKQIQYSSSRTKQQESQDNQNSRGIQNEKQLKDSLLTNKFSPPKKAWIFIQNEELINPINSNKYLLLQRNLNNTLSKLKSSQYEPQFITFGNYNQFLTAQANQKIQELFKKMSLVQSKLVQLKIQPSHGVFNQIKYTQQRLIIYHILNQHGGIYIDKALTLVTELNWIENIIYDPFLNIRTPYFIPKFFAFYHPQCSSLKQRLGQQSQTQPYKFVVKYPCLDDTFLIALKQPQFLDHLIHNYYFLLDTLFQPSISLEKQIKSDFYIKLKSVIHGKMSLKEDDIGKIFGTIQSFDSTGQNKKLNNLNYLSNLLQSVHKIACHLVIQQKEAELNQNAGSQKNKPFAPEYFGLLTINTLIGPQKLSHFYFLTESHEQQNSLWVDNQNLKLKQIASSNSKDKQLVQQKQQIIIDKQFNRIVLVQIDAIYRQLSKITLTEFESYVGPMRYVYFLPYLNEIQKRMKVSKNNQTTELKEEYFIRKKSFLYEVLFKDFETDGSFIRQNEEMFIINPAAPEWIGLPRNIWIIWDNGIQNSSPFNQICIENIKKSALKSGFKVHIVDRYNIKEYLDEDILNRIQRSITNAAYSISSQIIADTWRLALIIKYGGVYLDSTFFFPSQNFDWLNYITRIPSQLIFNRYNSQPKIVMFFNDYKGSSNDWHLDKELNTKRTWFLSYENNFFASVKQSEFMKEWLDLFLQWITLPYQQIQRQMISAGVLQHKWTTKSNRYLSAMDSLKCVIGRRQIKLIQEKNQKFKDASQYYNIWSLPGFIGPQKFRNQTNYLNYDYRYHSQQNLYHNVLLESFSQDDVHMIVNKPIPLIKFYGWEGKREDHMILKYFFSSKKDYFHQESIISKYFLKNEKFSYIWNKRTVKMANIIGIL